MNKEGKGEGEMEGKMNKAREVKERGGARTGVLMISH